MLNSREGIFGCCARYAVNYLVCSMKITLFDDYSELWNSAVKQHNVIFCSRLSVIWHYTIKTYVTRNNKRSMTDAIANLRPGVFLPQEPRVRRCLKSDDERRRHFEDVDHRRRQYRNEDVLPLERVEERDEAVDAGRQRAETCATNQQYDPTVRKVRVQTQCHNSSCQLWAGAVENWIESDNSTYLSFCAQRMTRRSRRSEAKTSTSRTSGKRDVR